jgi:SAM-dependent methyltransferase
VAADWLPASDEPDTGGEASGERLARYYDLDLRDDPGDADLYTALAARTGGPVLELACGTGRLLEPLLASGAEVTGVDVDPAMLARAERRLGSGRAAQLVCADLLDVDLGARFGMAFIALNSLLLLADAERQAGALAALARHLRPDGLAVVDAWLPGVDDLALYDGRLIAEWTRRDPETDEWVLKLASAAHDAATGTVELDAFYDAWAPDGGAVLRTWRRDRLRLVTADELVRMARDAGLTVDTLSGDYGGTPFGPGADRVVLIGRLV